MVDNDAREMWEELKQVWKSSPRREQITIQVTDLIAELQTKVGQFERDSIKSDIKTLRTMTSQFEKNSISRDLTMITAAIRKLIRKFRREP